MTIGHLQLYCMACDPKQPDYVRYGDYYGLVIGGQKFPKDKRYIDTPFGYRGIHLICSSWAQEAFGYTQADVYEHGPEAGQGGLLHGGASRFHECGIKKSTPCSDRDGDIIYTRDRYVCGDDMIMPAEKYRYYGANGTGNLDPMLSVEAFLNDDSLGTLAPPMLNYRRFLIS